MQRRLAAAALVGLCALGGLAACKSSTKTTKATEAPPSSASKSVGATSTTTPTDGATAAVASPTTDPCALLTSAQATTFANALGGTYQVVGAPAQSKSVDTFTAAPDCVWTWQQQAAPNQAPAGPVTVTISLSTAAKGVGCNAYSEDPQQLKAIGDYALVGLSDGCVQSGPTVIHIAYQGQQAVGSASSVELQAFPPALTAALQSAA